MSQPDKLPCDHVRRGKPVFATAVVEGELPDGTPDAMEALVCVHCFGPLTQALLSKMGEVDALVLRKGADGSMTLSWERGG